jgi:N-formylglutamate amidohydrolase
VQRAAALVLAGTTEFSGVVNGRFKGGYVTRHYGSPGHGVHALQLEIAQSCYMDEAPPYPWDAPRAGALTAVLERLVGALRGCVPR